MKDFKNENEYGNMKTEEETYEGILLKTGDEGYRYYSTDIGNITLTSYYQSETSSTAIITMNASCPNAECIYIRLLKTNGEIIYSAGASAATISKQKSFMSAGTYIVEAEAYGDNGTKKIKRTAIEVNTATGPVYNCENCCDKGWLSPTYKCNQCDAWENNFAPTLINYTYESTTSSTFNVTMNAVCHNAYNMYIRLKNANGNEVNNSSQGASATNVSKTVTFLGFGTYTIEVEVIASDGRRKTDELTFELTENSGDSSGSYETVAGSSDCSYCNGKGFIGNVVCNKCRHSEEYLSDITITYSNIVESASYIDEDAETTYTLSSSVNCPNACNIYATLVDNTTNERKGSFGASSTTVTANFTNLKQGTYRMEARAISSSGMEKYKNEIIDVPYIGAAPAEQDEPELWYDVVGHNHTAGTYSISFSSYYSGATQMQVDIKNVGGELVYTTGKVAGSVAGDRVDLPAGEYQAIATAYTWNNAHPTNPKTIKIPTDDMDIFINEPVITDKGDGTSDVKIVANTAMANNMYLKVIDDENEEVKYSYETSSNRFDVTCNLPSGDYTIVVNSVYYEGTICRTGEQEKPITVGHPVGGGPGGDNTGTTPGVEDIPDNERKFLLLYTGPDLDGGNYPEFTTADIQKLKVCGATDFVLLTAGCYNYKQCPGCAFCDFDNACTDGVQGIPCGMCDGCKECQILSSINEENEMLYKSRTHCTEQEWEQYKEAANVEIAKNNQYTHYSYEDYISAVVKLAKKLHNMNEHCRLWIGLPIIMHACTFMAEDYNHIYLWFMNRIKEEMQTEYLWNNVVGFYYGTEGVPTSYTDFLTSDAILDYNNDVEICDDCLNNKGDCSNAICHCCTHNEVLYRKCFNNTIVYNMSIVSKAVHSDAFGKKLLWIPYYTENTYIRTRIGHIINKTNLFDIAILQTTHFFKGNESTKNVMNIVYDYVDKQFCLYPNVKETFEGEYNQTTVGFEVEMGYGSIPYVVGLVGKLYAEAEAKAEGKEIKDPVPEEQKIAHEKYQVPSEELTKHLGYHGKFVETFSKFINGEVKACMAFYVGDRNEIFESNLNILDNINDIFKREMN